MITSPSHPAGSLPGGDPLAAAVGRWVDAGIISRDQGDAALAAETAERANSAAGEQAARTAGEPRAGLAVEALAYLGGALVLGSALLLVEMTWGSLTPRERVALPAVSALLALAAGGWLRRSPARSQPSLLRLQSGLWLLGTGLVAATGAVVGDQVLRLDFEATWLLVGAATAVVALPLYRVRAAPAQHVGLYLALVTSASGLAVQLDQTIDQTGAIPAGVAEWVVSVAWVALAAVGAVVGAVVGVPAAAEAVLRDPVAAPLALLVAGGLLVAVGVVVMRRWATPPA